MIRKIISPLDLFIDGINQDVPRNTLTQLSSIPYPSMISFTANSTTGSVLYKGYIYESGYNANRIYDLNLLPDTSQNNIVNVIIVDNDGKPTAGTVRFYVGPVGLTDVSYEVVEVVTTTGLASYAFASGLAVIRFDIIAPTKPMQVSGTIGENKPAVLYSTSIIDDAARVYVVQIPNGYMKYDTNPEIDYIIVYDKDGSYDEYVGLYKVVSGEFWSDRNLSDLNAIAFGLSIEPEEFIFPQATTINLPLISRVPIMHTVTSGGGLPTRGIVIHNILDKVQFSTPYVDTYYLYGVVTDSVHIITYGHDDYFGIYGDVVVDTSGDFILISVKDSSDNAVSGALVVTDAGTTVTNSDGVAIFPVAAVTHVEIYKFGYESISTDVMDPENTYVINEAAEGYVTIKFVDKDTNEPIKAQYTIRKVSDGSDVQSGDADGFISLEVSASDSYIITVNSYGYGAITDIFYGLERTEIILPLVPVEAPQRGDIILTIYDESTSRPIAGVDVMVSDLTNMYITETTGDMGYVILNGIAIGKTYNIKIVKDGYGYYEGNISLPADADGDIIFEPLREQPLMSLNYDVSTFLNKPIIKLSISLTPTYEFKTVEVTTGYLSNLLIPLNWNGPLDEKVTQIFNITGSGSITIPRDLAFTIGSPISGEYRGGKVVNNIVVPGLINLDGSYTSINIGNSISIGTNLAEYSYSDKNINDDGLFLHVAETAAIELELLVNNAYLDDYSCVITSDYHEPSFAYADHTVSFSGYLNLPYHIVIRGPGVYYDGYVVFTNSKVKINVPVSSISQCHTTMLMTDAYGSPLVDLPVHLTIYASATAASAGSVAETTISKTTDSDGAIVFDAAQGSIFRLVSSSDASPLFAFGTIPSDEQAVIRINPSGLLHDTYTYVLKDDSDNPIEAASVWITLDIDGKYTIAGPKLTNDSGEVSFTLLPALRTVYAWANKTGIIVNHVESWSLS